MKTIIIRFRWFVRHSTLAGVRIAQLLRYQVGVVLVSLHLLAKLFVLIGLLRLGGSRLDSRPVLDQTIETFFPPKHGANHIRPKGLRRIRVAVARSRTGSVGWEYKVMLVVLMAV